MQDHSGDEDEQRPGERSFAVNPAARDDARLAFIGRIVSPWLSRQECPKNLREARERARPAVVEIDEAFREGLLTTEKGEWLLLLTWLDRARRDLSVQAPRHAKEPKGTFSLRSPVRPNPIGLHLVRVLSLDRAAGRLVIDAIDVLDGTPLLDIKPFHASVDIPPTGDPALGT